jgi:hypothetical protein
MGERGGRARRVVHPPDRTRQLAGHQAGDEEQGRGVVVVPFSIIDTIILYHSVSPLVVTLVRTVELSAALDDGTIRPNERK